MQPALRIYRRVSTFPQCVNQLSPAGGDHLGGVLVAGFGDIGAGDHSGYFVGAGAVVEDADLGFGAAVGLALFYDKVLIGEGGDLREMGHAEDLLAAAEGFELLADGFGGAASDADVDFVEDEGAGGWILLVGFGGILFDGDFEGQHYAGHFAAGGDFGEGLERLAGVGGDAALDFIPAGGCPVGVGSLRG